jgi:hypothetical protein
VCVARAGRPSAELTPNPKSRRDVRTDASPSVYLARMERTGTAQRGDEKATYASRILRIEPELISKTRQRKYMLDRLFECSNALFVDSGAPQSEGGAAQRCDEALSK